MKQIIQLRKQGFEDIVVTSETALTSERGYELMASRLSDVISLACEEANSFGEFDVDIKYEENEKVFKKEKTNVKIISEKIRKLSTET